MKRKTIVLGASSKPDRYSYRAVNRLHQKEYEVLPLGFRQGTIGDLEILTEWPAIEDIDTISLYLNPMRQSPHYDYILNLKPKRVIFNPGTENPELIALLKKADIEAEIACTLVLLATDAY